MYIFLDKTSILLGVKVEDYSVQYCRFVLRSNRQNAMVCKRTVCLLFIWVDLKLLSKGLVWFIVITFLPGGELNPGLPRDRRGYWPLYYRGCFKSLTIALNICRCHTPGSSWVRYLGPVLPLVHGYPSYSNSVNDDSQCLILIYLHWKSY